MIVEAATIVLKKIPYGDSSLIVQCFTREYGKIGIMVRGVQSRRSPKGAYFQPANYLETLFYYKPNRDLQLLSKVSFRENWFRLQEDLKRIAYALAAVELVEKTVTDHDPHEELFDELMHTLRFFNNQDRYFNFCFWYFELKLLELLGFKPLLPEREFPGYILPDPAAAPHSKKILELLMKSDIRTNSFLYSLDHQEITPADRTVIANYITSSLEYHFEKCKNLKSLKVLRQLLAK